MRQLGNNCGEHKAHGCACVCVCVCVGSGHNQSHLLGVYTVFLIGNLQTYILTISHPYACVHVCLCVCVFVCVCVWSWQQHLFEAQMV